MNEMESQEHRDWIMKRRAELQPLFVEAPDLADEIWDALIESWGDELEPVHVHDVVREILFPGPQPSADEVAHHEAAHAVVAAAVGCGCTRSLSRSTWKMGRLGECSTAATRYAQKRRPLTS